MGQDSLRAAHIDNRRGGRRIRHSVALTLSLLLAIGGNLYLTAPPAAVAAPSCTVNPMGASTPIGSDNGYTFFTSGDAVLGNTEMEGTLAVGGTAKFGDSSANTNLQYPIFQGGVGGNANYGIPKIDGDWNRVLLNRYAPGTQAKVVQLKADGLTATPGLAKFVQTDSPSGYTFRKDYGSSGTTFWPSSGTNNSAQFASFVQPWKGTTDVSADGVTEAIKSFKTSGSFTSYFPQDNGTSILAGVTDWKTPTVTTNGETIVNLDLSGPNRLNLSDFTGAIKFGFPSGITYSPCAPLVVKITCVNANPIPAGADGPVLTVVIRNTAITEGEHRNVAYVSPAGDDVVEQNVLEVPGRDTDTTTTGTDNDAQAVYAVAGVQDPEPGTGGGGSGGGLAFTGADLWPIAGTGLGLLLLGLVLLIVRRREA